MLVGELNEHLAGRREASTQVKLGDLEVSDDFERMTVRGTGLDIALDTQAERTLAGYLDVNKTYLARCPEDLKAMNVNYWLRNSENTDAVLETSDDKLVSVHQPGRLVLPLGEVANVIDRVFNPQDEVVTLMRNSEKFHIDIKTPHSVEVRPDERIEGRQVGDITHGGVRLIAHPEGKEVPELRAFLWRLWCTNGCCSPTAESRIRLRGNTVPEIMEEMEEAARQVLSGMDNRLQEYAATADVQVPGSPASFALSLAREHDLPLHIRERIVNRAGVLPGDASLYDVLQVFTALANGQNVNYKNQNILQGVGGEIAFHTNRVVHRCNQCQHLLPE